MKIAILKYEIKNVHKILIDCDIRRWTNFVYVFKLNEFIWSDDKN